MNIIRTKKSSNFTVISNDCLRDKELSWKAKGLITYLMSLPEDWKICVEDLKNRSTDGKDSTSNTIKELIKNNYCKRVRERKQDGTFGDFSYIISDSKIIENPESVKPETEKPTLDNPSLLNTIQPNTILINTNKEECENEFSPPPPHKKSIEERKSDLYKLISEKIKETDFAKSSGELRKFFEYWSEHGDSDKKMRFEKEKSFEVLRRLKTWFENAKKFNVDQPKQNSILNKKLED